MSPDTSVCPSSLVSCHLHLALSSIFFQPYPSNALKCTCILTPCSVWPLSFTSTLSLSFLLSSPTFCCPADHYALLGCFSSPLHLHSILLYSTTNLTISPSSSVTCMNVKPLVALLTHPRLLFALSPSFCPSAQTLKFFLNFCPFHFSVLLFILRCLPESSNLLPHLPHPAS